jgi:hypothetical protein
MKKLLTKCVLAGAALFSAAAAFGASRGVTVHVPFDFVAGSVKLPAGDYYVSQSETQSVVYVTSLQTRRSVIMMPESNILTTASTKPGVQFVKTANGYFMKVVRVDDSGGFQLRMGQ